MEINFKWARNTALFCLFSLQVYNDFGSSKNASLKPPIDLDAYALKSNVLGQRSSRRSISIDLDSVEYIFKQDLFSDRFGNSFRFTEVVRNNENLVIPFHILHSKYGLIKNLGVNSAYPGYLIYKSGLIDARQANIVFAEKFTNLGIMSSFFKEFADVFPPGVEFLNVDTSATAGDFRYLKKMSIDRIAEFIRTSDGFELYKIYLEMTLNPILRQTHIATMDPSKDHHFEGFRHYLKDVLTIHGRIRRKGDFRSLLLSNEEYRSDSPLQRRIKIESNQELFEREQQVVGTRESVAKIKRLLEVPSGGYRLS